MREGGNKDSNSLNLSYEKRERRADIFTIRAFPKKIFAITPHMSPCSRFCFRRKEEIGDPFPTIFTIRAFPHSSQLGLLAHKTIYNASPRDPYPERGRDLNPGPLYPGPDNLGVSRIFTIRAFLYE